MKLIKLNFKNTTLFGALFLALQSCTSNFNSQVLEAASYEKEDEVCQTSFTYTGGITLDGQASFERRTIVVTPEIYQVSGVDHKRLGALTLGDPIPVPLPIRFAEVAVYDSKNNLVQCGTTDASGNLKALTLSGTPTAPLIIPNTPGPYTVKVLSRFYKQFSSSSDYGYVSVKSDIYKNRVYSVQQTATSNGSAVSYVSLLARARQTDDLKITGGAFNIMNSLYSAFDYIKTNTPGIDTQCLSNKINVFWKAGFNAYQYLEPSADPETLANTSYYSSKTKSLYITGGRVGDVSLDNTDHFDDFAVIHEFGHFIEDHCGQWTSPGGTHSLVFRIDPRLAWSESWSNYLAASVLQDRLSEIEPTLTAKLIDVNETAGWSFFFNSYGFSDSIQQIGNGAGFYFDMKKPGSSPGAYQSGVYKGQEFDKVNPSLHIGEGHTREGAISRGLYKITHNNCGSWCSIVPLDFENIWRAFDRITGIGTVNHPFVSSNQFLERLRTQTHSGVVDWTTPATAQSLDGVLTNEALHLKNFPSNPFEISGFNTWPGYGAKLGLGSCSLKTMPVSDGSLNNSTSDPRFSNHFYALDLNALSGLTQISVTFTKAAGTSVDHDLLLFKPGYFFNDDYKCTTTACTSFGPIRTITADVVASDRTALGISALTTYSKKLTDLHLLEAKTYLLDIRAYTASKSVSGTTEYSYTINSNLGVLCPQ